MIEQIAQHRSIRKFESRKIDPIALRTALEAALRASTCGNMQSYTIIVSQEDEQLKRLSPCHFGQVERMNAPCVVTLCADVARFSAWCRERNAEPRYDNFIWFLNGCIDGMMAAQNLMLEAEAQGLGVCVLGTTLYTAEKIIEILELPVGVIPVTSVVLGYPAEEPALTDRLPYEAVVHMERYTPNVPEHINSMWAEKEALEETRALIDENKTDNLAQIFTQYRYKGADNVTFSKIYFDVLNRQGFFNHEE